MGATSRPPRVPFLVSYGAEDFLLDREIARARKWPNRDILLFDGEDLNEGSLIERLDAAPINGPKAVILDNAQKVKLGKKMKAYVEAAVKADLSTILFAVVRSESLSAGWQNVASKGESSAALKFKPWQTKEILAWVNGEASSYEVKLAPGVDKVLLDWVSLDLHRLANEIRKLAIYVGAKGTITQEHLNLIVSRTPSVTQFQVAETAIAKNAVGAMNALSILYKNEGNECLVPLTNALMRQVERALIVRRLLDKGVDADLVAASVGLDSKKFPYTQLSLAASRHSARDLVKHMGRLCKLDADVKSAASSKRTLVELAVLAIAR